MTKLMANRIKTAKVNLNWCPLFSHLYIKVIIFNICRELETLFNFLLNHREPKSIAVLPRTNLYKFKPL